MKQKKRVFQNQVRPLLTKIPVCTLIYICIPDFKISVLKKGSGQETAFSISGLIAKNPADRFLPAGKNLDIIPLLL